MLKSFLKFLFLYFNRRQTKICSVMNYSTIQLFNCSTAIIVVLLFYSILPTQAFEDYIITTKGRLTDISIEDNTLVDICPLITIMNDKNTLIVSPLKTGKTRFCVLKNGKEKVMFYIEVTKDKTYLDDVDGFEILAIDSPLEEEFVLDEPPTLKEIK